MLIWLVISVISSFELESFRKVLHSTFDRMPRNFYHLCVKINLIFRWKLSFLTFFEGSNSRLLNIFQLGWVLKCMRFYVFWKNAVQFLHSFLHTNASILRQKQGTKINSNQYTISKLLNKGCQPFFPTFPVVKKMICCTCISKSSVFQTTNSYCWPNYVFLAKLRFFLALKLICNLSRL